MIYHSCQIFIFFCLILSDAQISSIIDQTEIGVVKARASAYLSLPSTLSDAYYATEVLKSVGVTGFQCNCPAIENLAKQDVSILDAYYGASSASTCGCNVNLSAEMQNLAASGLEVINL